MTKELSAGEPVAYLYTTKIPCEYGFARNFYSPTKWGRNEQVEKYDERPLHSQEYVNQLLGEIDRLKSEIQLVEDKLFSGCLLRNTTS